MKHPYDLNKTGPIARVLLLVYCVAELAFIWQSYQLFGFYDLIETGALAGADLDAVAADIDARGAIVGGLFLLSLLAAYVVSGMWIYRASANAQVLSPLENRITPGWSVGWFFVPLANLVMPYKAIREAWNTLKGNELEVGLPGWALIWWLCWIFGNLFAAISMQVFGDAQTMDDHRLSSWLDISSSVVAIIAALLFRKIILEMTQASATATPASRSTPHPEE